MTRREIESLWLEDSGSDVLVKVRAVPGASRDRLAGCHAGALRIAVSAAPEKGKANDALARVLAALFSLKPSRVHLERGRIARDKLFRIEGVSAADVRAGLTSLGDA